MYMYAYVNIPVTTTNSPLDLGVEAIDPYITIQANGTHAIARRMDDKIETITSPKLVII